MTRFEDLWERFLSDTLSEAEARELKHLLQVRDGRIPDAIDKLLQDRDWNGLAPLDKGEAILQRVLNSDSPQRHGLLRKMAGLGRWAAAAILLFLVAGIYFLSSRRQGNQALVSQKQNTPKDMPPGHNGAILTLSNGEKIILDSAGNGVLASDASVNVVKKDGRISYEGKAGEVVYNDIVTPKGREWQLTLGDGTKVWLNAGSSIHYPLSFLENQRVVEITGEAYFEVAPNAKAPFIVKTAQREIRVLGTHFNVNAYVDEPALKVTLLEGSVKVVNGSSNTIIKPGEQLVSTAISAVPSVKEVDTDDVVAWINGRFKFDNSDIRTVMRQIERWYNVEVEYRGTPPNYQFVGGTYRNINLSEVLKVLELSGVHFERAENKIIVLP